MAVVSNPKKIQFPPHLSSLVLLLYPTSIGMDESLILELNSTHLAPKTPSVPVWSLASISPAILELITHHLNGYDIASLYCTCSSVIICKMPRGVHEITIFRNDPVPPSFLSFGSCLRACSQLRSLFILNPSLIILQRGPKLFNYLPQTLETLKLHLPVSFGDFLLIDAYPQSKRAKKMSKPTSALQDRNIFPSFSVKTLFPRLCVFSVSVSALKGLELVRYTSRARSKVLSIFFEKCPPSLRSVELAENLEHFECLPESIDTLGLTFGTGDEFPQDWNMLPENLVRLTLNTSGAELKDFTNLPKHLERLVWIHNAGQPNFPCLSGLSHTSLIYLSLQWCGSTRLIGTGATLGNFDLLEALPRTLQVLILEFTYSPILTFPFLPPLLTELVIHVEHAYQSIHVVCPPTLRSLSLTRRMFVQPDSFALLPRELRQLTIDLATTARVGGATPLPSDCAEQCALNLPESLVNLSIRHSSFNEKFLAALPKHLMALEFSTVSSLSESSLCSLPDTLTSLTLGNCKQVHQRAFDKLPADLLELIVESGEEFDDRAISNLPRGLLHLTINKCNNFTDRCIKDLPKTLLTLIVPESSRFSVGAALRLPRFLQQLKVKGIIMTHPRLPRAQIIAGIPGAIDIHALPWISAKGKKVVIDAQL